MKRRNFLKVIAASAIYSAVMPRLLRFKHRVGIPYPGPVKELNPEKIKKEGPWTG